MSGVKRGPCTFYLPPPPFASQARPYAVAMDRAPPPPACCARAGGGGPWSSGTALVCRLFLIKRIRPRAGRGQVQKHKAEQNSGAAVVDGGKYVAGKMRQEIGEGHFAR